MEDILNEKELNIYNLFIQGTIANLEEPEGLYLYLNFVYKNKYYNIILDLWSDYNKVEIINIKMIIRLILQDKKFIKFNMEEFINLIKNKIFDDNITYIDDDNIYEKLNKISLLDLFCKIFYNYWLVKYDKIRFIREYIK